MRRLLSDCRRLGAALLLLGLAGCADPQLEALDEELAAIRANPGPSPRLNMPEVPDYEATSYQEADHRSPFRPLQPEPQEASDSGSELAPDPDRPQEPLEAYPLEELALVGVLTVGGEPSALVRAPGGQVHRLRVGDYLGGNHGRIVSITHASVQLVELVPTGGGGWQERNTRITLNDD